MAFRQMVIDRLTQVSKLLEFETHKQTSKRRIIPCYYSEKLPLYQDEERFLKNLCSVLRQEIETKEIENDSHD